MDNNNIIIVLNEKQKQWQHYKRRVALITKYLNSKYG